MTITIEFKTIAINMKNKARVDSLYLEALRCIIPHFNFKLFFKNPHIFWLTIKNPFVFISSQLSTAWIWETTTFLED